MRIFSLIALAIGLATLPSPATANKLVSKQVAVGGFGSCIVRMAPTQSTKLMSIAPDTKEERKFLQTLVNANSPCLTKFSSLSMKGDDIRGAIAENLVLTDDMKIAKIAALLPTPPVRAVASAKLKLLPSFASCIVRAEPGKSLALLKTEYRSVEESNAVAGLETVLVNCIPENVEYALNVPNLRNHIAMAIYELLETGKTRVNQ